MAHRRTPRRTVTCKAVSNKPPRSKTGAARRPPHLKTPVGDAASRPSDEFRRAVSDVIPLPARNKASLAGNRRKPIVRSRGDDHASADELSDHVPFVHEPGAPLSFSRAGVQRQAVRQLRRSGAAEDELDLHGLTVAEARPLLVAFLNASRRRGLRCVRVIHGKGLRSDEREGVLKGLVASWLAQRDDVLAFTQASAREGGSGAVIVLLRSATA